MQDMQMLACSTLMSGMLKEGWLAHPITLCDQHGRLLQAVLDPVAVRAHQEQYVLASNTAM